MAHVSPDAGWPQLKKFLEATKKQLTIGMYDFGAPHIFKAIAGLKDRNTFRKFTLVMQKGESVGEGTKADDMRDEQVVEEFEDAFGGKFDNAWVKIGRVNGWVSSSYHIKVAVRDSKAFWLSSGNMQSSNQPNAEPLKERPQKRHWLDEYNREWHAIIEHEGLAKTYEAYLLNDFENNKRAEVHEELALPDIFLPVDFLLPAEAALEFKYFEPFDQTRSFKVVPLLTPDKDSYHKHVLELIESAEDELLIQNQTFNAPGENHDQLRELVQAVLGKQQDGVKVRVIFRLLDATKAKNCHTKGIIADRKRVLLGSQNWSNDGVSTNRDASLLFDDKDLADYFAKVFEHDWKGLASKSIGATPHAIELAPAREKTPKDMVRLSWKDYMEMC